MDICLYVVIVERLQAAEKDVSWPERFGSGSQLDETTKDGDGFSILVPSNMCLSERNRPPSATHYGEFTGQHNTLTGGS